MPHQIGKHIIELPFTESTNTYLENLLDEQDLPEGTLVITDKQTAGLGQGHNTWESEPGSNLTFSFFLKPTFLKPEEQFYLNMSVTLGICGFLSEQAGIDKMAVKWPNDIYINNKKIAGILIRNIIRGNSLESAIVGIGLNVNQEKFSPGIPNPVSMFLVSERKYNLKECLESLLKHLNRQYQSLRRKEFDVLRERYLSHLFHLGVVTLFRDKERSFRGTITGITAFGELIIGHDTGETKTYGFQEITMIIDNPADYLL